MRKILRAIALLTCIQKGFGQQYQSARESIDKRPVPGWFVDARFGIFIH